MGVEGLKLARFGGIDGLRELQLQRLRETIRRAEEHVPYHQTTFAG